jgi:molecular chaperone Hsp33
LPPLAHARRASYIRTMTPASFDQALAFTIPQRHARGRLVRLGDTLDRILAPHGYPPAIERVLAEAVVLAALLGATLKDATGQLTLQAQTEDGVIDLLVADYRGGALRGYVRHDPDRLGVLPADPSLPDLFGKGYLALTFDQAVTGERYQGIVPLEGESLADAAQSFLAQSEQIPSLVRIAITRGAGGGCVAGGLMLQHLPEGEEGRERLHTRLDHPEWEHVATLGGSVRADELVDPALDFETLLWRLFNEEEVRVHPGTPPSYACRCDPDHFARVIGRFPAEEQRAMINDAGVIEVHCEYCGSRYAIEPVAA